MFNIIKKLLEDTENKRVRGYQPKRINGDSEKERPKPPKGGNIAQNK